MSQKVLDQIKYLCKEIAKVEWSGIIFYKVEGSIKDPSNMKIVLEEILPMHKGTSTYTEYTFDERVVEHMMNNEHLEDCKIGHIHSHNTMSVFFSGTDWDELSDNAPNHNIYFSLIVNNYMDFCAKVAFMAESSDLSAKDENGNPYTLKVTGIPSGKKMLSYDCEIISPVDTIKVEDDFSSKVQGIIEDAAKRVVPTKNYNYAVTRATSTSESFEDDWSGVYSTTEDTHVDVDFEDAIDASIEDFTIYAINVEGTTRVFHNVTDIIKYHKSKYITGRTLAKGVLNTYYQSYKRYYEQVPEMQSSEKFVRVTREVIDNLEHERDSSTLPYMDEMLTPTIDGLESMLKHFKNDRNTIK